MAASRLSLPMTLCFFLTALPPTPMSATIDFLGDFHLNLHGHPFETVPEMEKRVKKLVNNGVKFALPYMMPAITEIQLSPGCTHGFLRLMRGVMDIRDWAFKMVDALGKPSAGILEGTATALGDYDECLEITVPKNQRIKTPPPYAPDEEAFHGQYCMIQINLPEALRDAAKEHQAGNKSQSVLANSKTFLRSLAKIAPRADIADFRLGACIPSTCTNKDLQAIVDEIAKLVKIEATVLRCETRHENRFKTDHVVILTVVGIIILVMIVGTIYETVIRLKIPGKLTSSEKESWSFGSRFLLSFSVYNNTQELTRFHSIAPQQSISCIRGMKFISVCLYVVVSTYATPHDFHFLKYRSVFHFYKFMDEWWFTVFANASAGVDTLFFITGLQITYRLWKKSDNLKRVRVNIFKFIGVWFMRLSSVQLLVIALFLCLALVGKGPIWGDVVGTEIEKCRQNWWKNALFIDSFWSSTDKCLTHTWIVSSLMHLLIFGAIILWVLSRCESVGFLTNVALILGSSVAVAMVTLVNDLPPAPAFYFLSFLNLNRIWDKLFIQAYDHMSPFCVGIMVGYYLARHDKVKLSRVMVALGWTLTLLCNMTVLCGLYGYRHGESMNIILSAIYASVHRLGWSLGIAWIVFACVYGYGGVINDVLSWKVFIPLERLSNLTYLLHPLILYLHGGQIREKMYMAHLDQAMYATAYIVFTVALSALCYICFFVPYLFLERNIWCRDSSKVTKRHLLSISRTIKNKIVESNVTCISISSTADDKKDHRIDLGRSIFQEQKVKT